jgi:hypothetical protein
MFENYLRPSKSMIPEADSGAGDPDEPYGYYRSGRYSFVPGVMPQVLLKLPAYTILDLLQERFGFEAVRLALDPAQTVPSPVQGQPDGSWLRRTNMVGVNVRTIGNFFNLVKYALSLPRCHRSLHLLPIWEPGVVGSLYGIVSWHLNPGFFSHELYEAFPALDTTEAQLKVVMNLMHLMGFSVGMDVIPHTDRFSEMVLAYPRYFEWVRREDTLLAAHHERIWEEVEHKIYSYLQDHGTADGSELPAFGVLFGKNPEAMPEADRHALLFGQPLDYGGRQHRRVAMLRYLTAFGYETLPMTMGPPYRGLRLDPSDFVTDETGFRWYQYIFEQPQAMSRVFGPLTRFKLFNAKNDNQHWELDFDRPHRTCWDYVGRKYLECQQRFNFDFMRGDMAHVQMRPEGVPLELPPYYDLLLHVKEQIQRAGARHFALFAESFLVGPDTMGYGDELAHLEAIGADVALGDLQSTQVGDREFTARFRKYLDLAVTHRVLPSFTVLTADKDDPRFDYFFHHGNLLRYFVSLFLPDLPSYNALGFETRHQHLQRGRNEAYTKLFVYQITDPNQPNKVTTGPYEWGTNAEQFEQVTRLRLLSETLLPELEGASTQWLLYPDPTLGTRYIAWRCNALLFVANLDTQSITRHVTVRRYPSQAGLELLYDSSESTQEQVGLNNMFFSLLPLPPGGCRIYRIQESA